MDRWIRMWMDGWTDGWECGWMYIHADKDGTPVVLHICVSEVDFNHTKTSFPYTGPREGPGNPGWATKKLSSRAGYSLGGQVCPALAAAPLAVPEPGSSSHSAPSPGSAGCLHRLIGTMESFARCNFKGRVSHCATIKMQRVRRSLYFFAIQLLKCAEIRFICCNCQQLAVSYHS